MALNWKLTIKNNGGSAVSINDLGISIAATSSYVANSGNVKPSDNEFSQVDLCKSQDLKDLVEAGTLVINNGTSDLGVAAAQRHLSVSNDLTDDMIGAIHAANSPTAANYFATMADLSGVGADSLQSAYNTGATIVICANGPVVITGNATDAPLKLTPLTAVPSTLTDGVLVPFKDTDGNIEYAVYDNGRTKLLSITEEKHSYTDGVNTANRYLYYGNNRSNNAGSPVAENSTIVKVVVKVQTAVTATLRLRKRSALGVNIASVTLTAAASAIVKNLNVDLTAGDELVAYWEQAAGNADYPTVSVYTKKRY